MGTADDTIGIEKLGHPQTIAVRTGTIRVIEREHARFDFLQAVVTVNAGIAGTH